MGFYIETYCNQGKADELVKRHGAIKIATPKSFNDIPSGLALICVVENGFFDAAGYCYDESEFNAFVSPDGRRKHWLLMDKGLAIKLSGYKNYQNQE
jgi:hypothetical protein